MELQEEIEGLRNANRILGKQLAERDRKDKQLALNWFSVGLCVGLLISIFL